MTNAELIKGLTTENLAQFMFKWQIVVSSKAMEFKFNELLNGVDMVKWLYSEDNTIINQIMKKSWDEENIDFTPFIEKE